MSYLIKMFINSIPFNFWCLDSGRARNHPASGDRRPEDRRTQPVCHSLFTGSGVVLPQDLEQVLQVPGQRGFDPPEFARGILRELDRKRVEGQTLQDRLLRA